MVAPASIVVTIGIVLPVLILFRYSLNQFTPAKVMVDAVTLENYAKFFTDPFYRAILFRTIRVAALCTAACVVLAFPMAYCLARTRSRFKNESSREPKRNSSTSCSSRPVPATTP